MGVKAAHRELIDALCHQAHKMYKLRYQMSNGGNLSARVPGSDCMIVKGTDVDFANVSCDTLAVCDFDANILEGDVRPSKEAMLHAAIYRRFPRVMAIMHCHSPWATALAAGHEQLIFSTYHAAMKLKDYCPVFDTGSYIVSPQWIDSIIGDIEEHPEMNSFLLRGHGQVTMGKTIQEAASLAELVEETAQIALLSKLNESNAVCG